MSTTLFGMLTVIAIVFMVVVLPVWLLLHYLTRMKAMRGLNKEDEAALEKLWEDCPAMYQWKESWFLKRLKVCLTKLLQTAVFPHYQTVTAVPKPSDL